MKSKILMGGLAVGMMMVLSGGAFATQTNSGTVCNGNGSCAQTNNNNPPTNSGGTGGGATISGTVGGSATGGSVRNSGNSTIAAGAVTTGAVSNDIAYSNSNTYKAAASTAYAPALTSGNDTCMGSSSVGASGVGFGVSVGSTWTDNNCVRLKNAREMYAMGKPSVALAMMCQNADVRAAAEAAGDKVCAAAAAPDKQSPVANLGHGSICDKSTDEIVRSRNNCQ